MVFTACERSANSPSVKASCNCLARSARACARSFECRVANAASASTTISGSWWCMPFSFRLGVPRQICLDYLQLYQMQLYRGQLLVVQPPPEVHDAQGDEGHGDEVRDDPEEGSRLAGVGSDDVAPEDAQPEHEEEDEHPVEFLV